MTETTLSYGAFIKSDGVEFKLYAPKSNNVFLVIFDKIEDIDGNEFPMDNQGDGNWSYKLNEAGYGTLYGYRLEGPSNDSNVIIADPYSKAAVTQNNYRQLAKSLIVNTDYDWENDDWIKIDPRDLIIYEMHLRDMTVHSTSGSNSPGTYKGFIDNNQRGGINHIKEIGVNAVQFLPLQDFANIEIPYKDSSVFMYNDWNPYARNHWGYMTTFFFAPESYYASDGTIQSNAWNGRDGKAVKEMKDMVKELHNEGIAVIMDVVYNHVSNYDFHPLKYIDKETYFRLDKKGDYIAQSGCGNDCKTEHPAMRKLIIESVKYWMREYHIDGFRFDLGYLIDKETRKQILAELKKINPNAIILAEPWGAGYDPDGFSDIGWASFNDKIRNGVKGQNPFNSNGFIFGKWQDKNNQKSLQRFAMGSIREYGGQYLEVDHSVNYLEAHDDHTFGDFIRISTGYVKEHQTIINRIKNAKLTPQQLALNKLGALFLFTSQGITFIHEGQEWARSKVIANTEVPELHIGQIDHNSYNKDNETNWLNWDEIDMNIDLVNYYKGLIQFRKKYPEFRHSKPEDFEFLNVGTQVALAYMLQDMFIIALNGDSEKDLEIDLPDGRWNVLVNGEIFENHDSKEIITNKLSVKPTSGVVLIKN
ncbi:alpha-amylase family glycosyl hydrolase [Candidatus Neomarinimicrobiota bacterium]